MTSWLCMPCPAMAGAPLATLVRPACHGTRGNGNRWQANCPATRIPGRPASTAGANTPGRGACPPARHPVTILTRLGRTDRPTLRPIPGAAVIPSQPCISAAVCAFSVTSRVTQRDGVAGRGHAGKPHLAAPRRPGTHWRAPPRRSGGGPDRLPKPGSLDAAGAGTLPPAPDHPGSPGIRSAAGHPGDVLEFLQHRTSRPGLPAHPCAVTHDQPYREGRRAACGMHGGRGCQRHVLQLLFPGL